MINQYRTDNTIKYEHHKIKQTQRSERGEGFFSFASSVFGIINLSPTPGLKEASAERNNVLCMVVSVENK